MIDISFIVGFIGVAVGILLGILVYSQIDNIMVCPNVATDPNGNASCNRAKSISWTVLVVLPITLFFVLFSIFGGWSKNTIA